MIAALIFDFDGLIVDTETPAFESWRLIFAEYGHDLPLDLWQGALGTSHGFDTPAYLAELLGQPIDRAALLERRSASKRALAGEQPLLPGVLASFAQAGELGLPCALASSSDRAWIDHWLHVHQLSDFFTCIRTADDVALTKPAPDLFLAAADCLGVPPSTCLVFEDSANGILAARAAGMRCVAVPGSLTRQLVLPEADLRLDALDSLPLREIIARVDPDAV
ncbi:MAG TPA: HAD family hydrolase [Roseiflexaceae bacterium]|nr:HAD family hydrolase [Roseiflexaceae bacterium]